MKEKQDRTGKYGRLCYVGPTYDWDEDEDESDEDSK